MDFLRQDVRWKIASSASSKFVFRAKSFLIWLLIKEITLGLRETSPLVNKQTKNGEKRIPNESMKTGFTAVPTNTEKINKNKQIEIN